MSDRKKINIRMMIECTVVILGFVLVVVLYVQDAHMRNMKIEKISQNYFTHVAENNAAFIHTQIQERADGLQAFEELAWPKNINQEEHSLILDKEGKIIYLPEGMKRNAEFHSVVRKIDEEWQLTPQMQRQWSVHFSGENQKLLCQEIREGKIYGAYAPLGEEEWYLLSFFLLDFTETTFPYRYQQMIPSIMPLLIIFMGAVFCLVFIYRCYKKLKEDQRKAQQVCDESYRMMIEQGGDAIFDYDLVTRKIHYNAKYEKTFGYSLNAGDCAEFKEKGYVHSEDLSSFVDLYQQIVKEGGLRKAEIRMLRIDGAYIWVHLYLTGIFDQSNRLVRLMGKIEDIDEKRKEIDWFKALAEKDTATDLLNKQSTQKSIEHFLEGEGKEGTHAMFVVDLDNFKTINDVYGHRQGDFVLKQMGEEINRLFRSSDIKGRLGGDEFMILIKHVGELSLLADKAEKLCSVFRHVMLEDGTVISLTASAGIALYQRDGVDYVQLYEAADQALYYCKNTQKGTFCFSAECRAKGRS